MLPVRFLISKKDTPWRNLASFSSILFFVLLADALLSFWVPNFLQENLGSAFLMGLTMSFSSVVGFMSDLIFPQTLRNYTVRKLLMFAILSSFLFAVSLLIGLTFPTIMVFLIAMAIWGVYYEFLHFSQAQFVADSIPLKLRSSGWALIGIFRNLAYFIGPLFAGILLLRGEITLLFYSGIFLVIALLVFLFTHGKHERPVTVEAEKISIVTELYRWKVLFKKVWTIVLASLLMGLIDATFWTTGAVWTESLSESAFWGSFLLPAYQLPSLFMGIVVAKWGVYKGKKKISEKFLLLSGLFLTLLYFDFPVFIYIFIVFMSSLYLSVAYPLIEAVYSDIIARMGIERKHLVGLSASSISLAYIISPAIAGYLASMVGEKLTFVVVGGLTSIVAIILLFLTPKKIHLPKREIKSWGE